MIGVDGIYDRLKECAAEFKLVVVDACRNDPRPGGGRSMTATAGTKALARTLEEMKLPEGVVLLNSCAPGEISWEDEEFGHGVFMHYVLDALQGSADANDDGAVSLAELQSYAGGRTKTFVANRHRVAQRPFMKGDLTIEALEFALLPVPAGGLPPDAKPFENSLGMKLVPIPSGEFTMGSPDDEASREDDEPPYKVRITKPFYLGATEVTQAQYAALMGANPSSFEPNNSTGFSESVAGLDTRNFPVETVSYEDAVEFCRRLSLKEGKRYRLPTEAEWEYACRAGTTTPFSTGDALTGRDANING
jgi:formylglycine-generating enzyme required for sulfatase activity